MKHIKMLGLAVVAAMALMAFVGVGSASAGGVLCSTASNPCNSKWANGTVLNWSVPSGGSVTLENTAGTITFNTCTGATSKGKITANPAASGEAEGPNEEITWTGCTHESNTIALGGLRVQTGTAAGEGDVFANGEIKVTIKGLFPGENCIYGVAKNTTIGTMTEGIGTGAIFHANAIATKFEDPEHVCFAGPTSARWTGTYVLTSPSNTTLYVSAS